MSKLLTISIAAYNAEKTIKETLDSLIIEEVLEDIEVLIIDDGGTDNTLSIATEYENRYPQTFRAIHKDNNGYGSVFNLAIEIATGLFFKLLDGDDWFDKNGLIKLVRALNGTSADVILTDLMRGSDKDDLQPLAVIVPNSEGVYDVSDFPYKNCFGMWSITYKTEVLRRSGLKLPQKCFYTDQLYSTLPWEYIGSVALMPIYVYCYRTGIAEQSTSRESRIKNMDDMLDICMEISIFAEKCSNNACGKYILDRTVSYYYKCIKTILLDKHRISNWKKLINYEKKSKEMALCVYIKAAQKSKLILILRLTRYLAYWILPKIKNWQ